MTITNALALSGVTCGGFAFIMCMCVLGADRRDRQERAIRVGLALAGSAFVLFIAAIWSGVSK